MSAPQIGDTVAFEQHHGITLTGTVMAEELRGMSRWLEVDVDGGFHFHPAARLRVVTPAARAVPSPALAAGTSQDQPVGEVPPGLEHLITKAVGRASVAALAFVEAFRVSGLDPVSITALVDAANAWERAR
ncbi:hypothetical protein [Xylanimonas protaetiae]|uniref:Uncharacterized protein n=1 Tax=Xylanimonas protaetiae TaxID=2509457 RepID=A0A4P6F2H1_9MICO|nr:hypothetical protein [Xylanimonas protaetiae]QAY70030.1 hypothetical protein ET471_08270 [Xylanimonas protaetiae]